jgi:hypothetical protein
MNIPFLFLVPGTSSLLEELKVSNLFVILGGYQCARRFVVRDGIEYSLCFQISSPKHNEILSSLMYRTAAAKAKTQSRALGSIKSVRSPTLSLLFRKQHDDEILFALYYLTLFLWRLSPDDRF